MLPNIISLTRIPLALLFLLYPSLRCLVTILAMISDVLDGFLARKMRLTSSQGAILDPITDKLFVAVALIAFLLENRITYIDIIYFLSRDLALILFVLTRYFYSKWSYFKVQAFYCGKLATTLQLCTLILLSLNLDVPDYLFFSMGAIGLFSYIELMIFRKFQSDSIQ